VAIRAYLPIWVFLYILQFLLMPLIAQDYNWVSNFFGNTLYLIALIYYFVITFLGYNGMCQSESSFSTLLTSLSSTPLPQPDRSPARTHTGPRNHMVHQLVHLRLCNEPRTGAMVWSRSAQARLGMTPEIEWTSIYINNLHKTLQPCYNRAMHPPFLYLSDDIAVSLPAS
jgi:hypothetical protein